MTGKKGLRAGVKGRMAETGGALALDYEVSGRGGVAAAAHMLDMEFHVLYSGGSDPVKELLSRAL